MTPGPQAAAEPLRADLARAFQELRPQMIDNARADADLDPKSRIDDFSEPDLEQFLNAYEALFMEALDGSDETRRFVLETALPPLLATGQTALDLIRGNVVSAVMFAHRLLPLVAPERRDDAARWLAAFHGSYTQDVAGRALALEAEQR